MIVSPLDWPEAPESPPPPVAPPPSEPRPRLWTLGLTLVVLFVGVLGLAILGFVATSLGVLGDADSGGYEHAQARLLAFIETTRGTLIVTGVSSLWFGVVAVAAAALSPKPFVERLALQRPPLSILTYAVLILAGAALGEAVDAFFLWSGLGRGEAIESMFALFRPLRGMELVLALCVVGGLAGTAEELFFRGYNQTRLVERFGPVAGIAIASIVFGLAHLDPRHALFAFLFGIYIGWVAWRTRSTWPAIVVHVVNNAMSVLMVAWGLGDEKAPARVSGLVLVGSLAVFALAIVALYRALPKR